MIGAIGWYFGGPYAAVACFLVGAALILMGLLREEGKSTRSHPSILTDEGSLYVGGSRLKSWHKYGLAVSILCIVVLVCFGIYRRHAAIQQTTTATSGPLQPLTPLESLTISPIKLIFKDQAIGKTSNPQTVTLINRASAPRFISEMKITGDFSQTNDCPSELMVGDSCNIEVTFTPKTPGLTYGGLEVSSHDPLFSAINLFAKVDFSGSGAKTKERGKGAVSAASTSPPQTVSHQQPGQPDPKCVDIGKVVMVNSDSNIFEGYCNLQVDMTHGLNNRFSTGHINPAGPESLSAFRGILTAHIESKDQLETDFRYKRNELRDEWQTLPATQQELWLKEFDSIRDRVVNAPTRDKRQQLIDKIESVDMGTLQPVTK